MIHVRISHSLAQLCACTHVRKLVRASAASHEYIDRETNGHEYSTGHMAYGHAHKVKVTRGSVTFDAVVAQCACSNVTRTFRREI